MKTQRTLFGIGAALLIGISAATFADNDNDDEEEHHNRRGESKLGKHTMASLDPAYQKECGSCHLAFPPSMLSSASWQKIMNGLANHFGENAEIPAPQAKSLTDYLVNNGSGPNSASLRITDTSAFTRKHHEVPKRVLKPQGQVTSMADCTACHTRAKDGSFRESEVKIPGLGRWE